MKARLSINLESYQEFIKHQWLSPLILRYNRDSIIAGHAIDTLMNDLENLNHQYDDEHRRVLFTIIEGRVKSQDSFFRKLHKICCENASRQGITQSSLQSCYSCINDLAGVRIACPYLDDVEFAIREKIRPSFSKIGYATDLEEECYRDRDYLDSGDRYGYRSYHFYIKTPTPIDIFGNVELFLCEIQARSELQHVWAVKSHDLLYKTSGGWRDCEDIGEEMRQLSNSLRAVDGILMSIRNRVRGGRNYEKDRD